MSNCYKIAYRNAAEAQKALEEIRKVKNPNSNNKPIRYYYCNLCDKFHLTHRGLDEEKLFDLIKNPPKNIQQQLEARLKHYGLK